MYNSAYTIGPSYKVRANYVGCFCMSARRETGYQKRIKSAVKKY